MSPLLDTLSPQLRSASLTSLSTEERDVFAQHVERMLHFGLRYRPEKDEAGRYGLRREPSLPALLPSLAAAEGLEPADATGGAQADANARRDLPAHLKQQIQAEIQRGLLRRKHQSEASAPGAARAQPAPAPMSAHAAAKAVVAPALPAKVARDIFGRPVETKTATAKRDRDADAQDQPAVRYKYHEGVTDAVRRKVRIEDL